MLNQSQGALVRWWCQQADDDEGGKAHWYAKDPGRQGGNMKPLIGDAAAKIRMSPNHVIKAHEETGNDASNAPL